MSHYYNENDPKAAAWLRRLIKDGHVPDGEVDDRSITEVDPDDIRGFRQAHFFAGIGGWALAVRLAGLEAKGGIWTGSCPCQPFSAAGRGKGTEDERHLWPEFYRLIESCQPNLVFGEQVAGKNGLEWLDLVCDDLEGGDYSPGAAIIPACSVGAPHKRDRLYWSACSMADAERKGRQRGLPRGQDTQRKALGGRPGRSGPDSWRRAEFIPCADGKSRPVEPSIPLLVDGLPARASLLRGYGNAVVLPLAQAFIEETIKGL